MDEVDYSKFLYKPVSPSSPPKREEKRPKKERPEKKRKGGKILLAVIVVLLCFALLFLCVDFFAKGNVTKKIYSMMSKNEYSYFLVASSYPTREMARAGSLLAEQNGGAGYLFTENGDYIVVFGVYTSQPNAQKVMEKNTSTFLYTLSYSTSRKELGNLVDTLVRDVCIALDKMDEGTFTESGLRNVFQNYVILFSAYECETDEEKELVGFILSCLNGLDPGITERTNLLFQTRHMLCSVLFSARETLA